MIATVTNLKRLVERVRKGGNVSDNFNGFDATSFVFHNNADTIKYSLKFSLAENQHLEFRLMYARNSEEVIDVLSYQNETDEQSMDDDDLYLILTMVESHPYFYEDFVSVMNRCLSRTICECTRSFIEDDEDICYLCELFKPAPEDLRKCPICLSEGHKRDFLKTHCGHEFHEDCFYKLMVRSGLNFPCPICRTLIDNIIPINPIL